MSNTQNQKRKNSNYSYKQSGYTFSQKWSQKQDEKLRQAVLKYGTQWTLISKKYRFDRSVNSLIKRWHGKLKEQNSNLVQRPSFSENDEQGVDLINLTSKKTKKQEKKVQKEDYKNGQKKSQFLEQKVEYPVQIKQNYKRKKQEQKRDLSKQEEWRNQRKQREQQYLRLENDIVSQMESDQSEGFYVFKHNWNQHEDTLLKNCILVQHILNWEELSLKLKINDLKEIKKRWQIKLYPSIVDSIKIGGCVKYSEDEDAILSHGVKLGLGINELRKFLPGRTRYSLDARRRRTLKMQEVQIPEMRFWTKRLNAYNFLLKRHEHLQKPAEQECFMYRSDSQ